MKVLFIWVNVLCDCLPSESVHDSAWGKCTCRAAESTQQLSCDCRSNLHEFLCSSWDREPGLSWPCAWEVFKPSVLRSEDPDWNDRLRVSISVVESGVEDENVHSHTRAFFGMTCCSFITASEFSKKKKKKVIWFQMKRKDTRQLWRFTDLLLCWFSSTRAWVLRASVIMVEVVPHFGVARGRRVTPAGHGLFIALVEYGRLLTAGLVLDFCRLTRKKKGISTCKFVYLLSQCMWLLRSMQTIFTASVSQSQTQWHGDIQTLILVI